MKGDTRSTIFYLSLIAVWRSSTWKSWEEVYIVEMAQIMQIEEEIVNKSSEICTMNVNKSSEKLHKKFSWKQ
jgi:hypothetical protein